VNDRIIVRTKSNLSFVGEICKNNIIKDQEGVFLKTNPKSEIKIWCPKDEIQCLIFSKDKIIEGDELKNEFRFY
jgi:hypothetical protein